MSEETVVRCCAPTLARLKTGSLFTGDFESQADMVATLRNINRSLLGKGLRIVPLRWRDGSSLLYLYRPGRLHRDLQQEEAAQLLRECGYRDVNGQACVRELSRRLRNAEAFPHEIGLFLGYPPDDVEGFMHRRDSFKLSGVWKVYGNVERARHAFGQIHHCTEIYLRRYREGTPLGRLVVGEK